MLILKRTGQTLIVLSLLGFSWLAWILLATPAERFDTQGPGILGAVVMFAAQLIGYVGLVLLAIWWLIGWERRLKSARPRQPTTTKRRRRWPINGFVHAIAACAISLGVTATVAMVFEHWFLNFDCPAGAIDYCPWTVVFVIQTFGPAFVLLTVICAIGLNKLQLNQNQ